MTESNATQVHDAEAGHGHAHEDHGGIGKYLVVFVALCILTMASFFTYSSYWPFDKHVAWAFMMAVSCTKAMLVVMFFMHLLWEANWKWVFTVPASCMSIFLVLMLVPDIGMRQNNGYGWYSFDRLKYTAAPLSEEEEGKLKKDVEEDIGQEHKPLVSPSH
jgi:cytochrome c oxidase subunit IV